VELTSLMKQIGAVPRSIAPPCKLLNETTAQLQAQLDAALARIGDGLDRRATLPLG